jgi:hypothetical protein
MIACKQLDEEKLSAIEAQYENACAFIPNLIAQVRRLQDAVKGAAVITATAQGEIARLSRERDAALKDLYRVVTGSLLKCETCAHYLIPLEGSPCENCDTSQSEWKWRGVQL